MEKLQQFWRTTGRRLLISDLVLSLVINPLFLKQHVVSRVQIIIWLLVLVNFCYVVWAGRRIAKQQDRSWQLLVFPVGYLIGVRLFQVSRYTYYFALVYLGIEYLAKAMTQDAVKNQSKESKLMQDVKKQ